MVVIVNLVFADYTEGTKCDLSHPILPFYTTLRCHMTTIRKQGNATSKMDALEGWNEVTRTEIMVSFVLSVEER